MKKKVKKVYNKPAPPSWYSIGHRWANILHTRIRLKSSKLAYELFRKNLSENSICRCGNPSETAAHFFLECPLYDYPRNKLLRTISRIISPGLNPLILPQLEPSHYIDILLCGSPDVPENLNHSIIHATQTFLISSGRFSR